MPSLNFCPILSNIAPASFQISRMRNSAPPTILLTAIFLAAKSSSPCTSMLPITAAKPKSTSATKAYGLHRTGSEQTAQCRVPSGVSNLLVTVHSNTTRALEFRAKKVKKARQIFPREDFDIHTHWLLHFVLPGINNQGPV